MILACPYGSLARPRRLPGDLRIDRDSFGFYFPIATSLIVSIMASLLIGWFRR